MKRKLFFFCLFLSIVGIILTVSSCKKVESFYTAEIIDKTFFFFIRNSVDPSMLDVLQIHVSGKTISPAFVCKIPILRVENFFILSKGVSSKIRFRPKSINQPFICSVFDDKINSNDREIQGEISIHTKKYIYRYKGPFTSQNYSPVACQISLSIQQK